MGFELLFQKLFEYFEQIIPLYIVDQFEHAILLRNGKKKKNLKPGIYFLPLRILFIDRVLTVLKEKDTFETGLTVTTVDGKTISVSVVVEFSIETNEQADNYLLYTNDAPSNARDIAASIALEELSECEWEEIKKKTIRTQIKNKLKEPLNDIGMDVKKVSFKNLVVTKPFTLFNK